MFYLYLYLWYSVLPAFFFMNTALLTLPNNGIMANISHSVRNNGGAELDFSLYQQLFLIQIMILSE